MAATSEEVKKHWEEVSRILQKLNGYIQEDNIGGISRCYNELHEYESKWASKHASEPGIE